MAKEIQPDTWYWLHDGVRFQRVKTQEGLRLRDGHYYWPVRAQIGFPRTMLVDPYWLVEDPEDPNAPTYGPADRARDWHNSPWSPGPTTSAPRCSVTKIGGDK
jgi:hypothetical protein